jgi:hypothetical protein
MKIIIWGHKLHSHTHSYIHGAFYKAFKYMGYDVHWFDENDIVETSYFKNCIFLTEGQVDKNIPIDTSNKYILHNCDVSKYFGQKYLNIQVYTNGKENSVGVSGNKLDNFTYYDPTKITLYQPWATDLLPEEIDETYIKSCDKNACWVGSIWGGYHGNDTELIPFVDSLKNNYYNFIVKDGKALSFEENKNFIKNHEIAPTIVGKWQKTNHYIPCRIFKNISYGKLGISNSLAVNELLDSNIIYSENSNELITKYLEISEEKRKQLFVNSVKIVKNKHTYLNRINQILNLL